MTRRSPRLKRIRISRRQLFDRTIDLINVADQNADRWISRHVTIQGALAAATAALINWGDGTLVAKRLGGSFLSLFAVLAAVALMAAIRRQAQWQRHYIRVIGVLQGPEPLLFSTTSLVENSRDLPKRQRQKEGYIVRILARCTWVLMIGWAVLAGLLLFVPQVLL